MYTVRKHYKQKREKKKTNTSSFPIRKFTIYATISEKKKKEKKKHTNKQLKSEQTLRKRITVK